MLTVRHGVHGSPVLNLDSRTEEAGGDALSAFGPFSALAFVDTQRRVGTRLEVNRLPAFV